MTEYASLADISSGPEITVRLLGRAAEFRESPAPEQRGDRGAALRLRLAEDVREITPRQLLAQVASENPLLRDQIVRKDGSPRSSTRILINGQPPPDLDMRMEVRQDAASARRVIVIIFDDGTVVVVTDVVIIVFVPCDG